MFAFIEVIQGPAGARLVAVLLHSLWQAAGLALLAAAALRVVPAFRAEFRYRISLSALALVVISPFLTWSFLGPAWNGEPGTAIAAAETLSHGVAQNAADSHDRSEADSFSATPPRAMLGRPAADLWFGVPKSVVPVLLAAWLVGAVVMLVRTAAHLHAARQLQSGAPVADPRLLELVEEVSRRLGLRKVVRVLLVGDLTSPVICGVWTPALVVPLSFLTGLTPDQQYAVVAHELAHIRRGDFLVNVLQLVVESILFFNPAVLWLSRQVRIEREACCDAVAVSLTDAPIEYVQTLADWAERMLTPAPQIAPAFSDPVEGGSLGDRVRRVLAPARAPRLRVRWGTLAGLLAAVAVALVLIARGTDWAVAQAAKALTDEERVQIVSEARRAVPVEEDLKNGKSVRVRAQLRTWDGKPVESFHGHLVSQSRGSSYGKGIQTNADGKLDTTIDGGMLSGSLYAKGYAPVILAERPAAGGTDVDLGEVVLPPGHSARIRFVDPQGKPVQANRISFAPAVLTSYPILDIPTAPDGSVTLPNVLDQEYRINARAAGFRPLQGWRGELPEDRLTTITMQPARKTGGMIRDVDGQPVGGVEIFVTREGTAENNYGYHHGEPGQLWTTSAADGTFDISQMADDGIGDFLLKKDGKVRGLMQAIKSGQGDLTWQLEPLISIRGRFEGDLNRISKDARYRRVFYSILRPGPSGSRDQVLTGNIDVASDGTFEVTGLVSGTFEISRDFAKVKRVLTSSIDDLVIPIASPESVAPRPLTLLFSHAGKVVTPGGSITVHSVAGDKSIAIRGRETPIEIAQTGSVRIDGRALLGFAIDPQQQVVFEAPELGPTLVIPVAPAGAIRGIVLDHSGKPLGGVSLSVRIDYPGGSITGPDEVLSNASGEFLASPVPLKGFASVTASLGKARVLSAPIEMNAAEPSQIVTLTIPRIVSAEVRVVNESGEPVANLPLGLKLSLSNAKTSSGFDHGNVTTTDESGRAVISQLGEPLSAYSLVPPQNGGWVYRPYRLQRSGVTEIQLQKGHVVAGIVLDDMGSPLAGISVSAKRTVRDPDGVEMQFAETDLNGRFRFVSLPDEPIILYVPGVSTSPAYADTPVPPDGPEVTIQGKPADWARKQSDRRRNRE